jgi:aspartyl-tRNA(Asn)/glutamyl-tRNA(Gln) amidotransferase subunit A
MKLQLMLNSFGLFCACLWLMYLSSIAEASELVRRKEVSPVYLTRICLKRIEEFNSFMNTFITVMRESALAQAREAEDEIRAGRWRGPLHGIPIGLKDLIDTAGVRTTCGSALFVERVPDEDAEVVRRLKNAGAVLIGKQNMQEFAWGGMSTSSWFGPVRNPWDPERIAGGSSGGSAAAVATGMCFGAIGTDTGGSVRQPAAFCGIVGLKPTYGLVNMQGVFPLSPSLDHVGPLCRTVQDTELMLQVIADYVPVAIAPSRPRIGVARSPFFADIDAEIEVAFNEALTIIGNFSADIFEVELPDTPTAVQAPEVYAIHSEYFAEFPDRYLPWMQERLRQAATIDHATYIEARAQLDRLRQTIDEIFAQVDFIVTPTSPVPPITIHDAWNMSPPPAGELWLRNTRPFNAYGIPTISVPCGFTSTGLPIGLQIAGPSFSEAALLSFAHTFEQATPWHKRTPSLFP